jgi:hypothetical protein
MQDAEEGIKQIDCSMTAGVNNNFEMRSVLVPARSIPVLSLTCPSPDQAGRNVLGTTSSNERYV